MKDAPDSELRHVLREESGRLRDLAALYQSRISELPKGYISLKKINGHSYAYRSFREKNKVRSVYIGRASSKQAAEMKQLIESRKKYSSQLRLISGRIRELKKILGKMAI